MTPKPASRLTVAARVRLRKMDRMQPWWAWGSIYTFRYWKQGWSWD